MLVCHYVTLTNILFLFLLLLLLCFAHIMSLSLCMCVVGEEEKKRKRKAQRVPRLISFLCLGRRNIYVDRPKTEKKYRGTEALALEWPWNGGPFTFLSLLFSRPAVPFPSVNCWPENKERKCA